MTKNTTSAVTAAHAEELQDDGDRALYELLERLSAAPVTDETAPTTPAPEPQVIEAAEVAPDAPEDVVLPEQPQPVLQTPEADAAIAKLNERFAWITSHFGIFRLSHDSFVPPNKFHLEYSNEIVEAMVGGELKKIRASEAWIRAKNRRTHDGVVYAPGEPRVTGKNINLWSGWGCEPKEGDVSPWIAFLDFIFGEDKDHRDWFEQWLAYPIKHPGTKLNTAVVLWSSRQGVGKTLIGQTVGRIYGPKNYKEITSRELKGKFNGWAHGCQFVLGEENSGASQVIDADRLKVLISGETMFVEEKYQPRISIRNHMNFLFTSNHPNAFYLESADRRYFVWEIQAAPQPPAFYEDFVRWRDERGGASALMHHLQNLDTSGFDPMGKAPMTSAKAAMIDIGRTDIERWLASLRNEPGYASSVLGREVFTLEELSDLYYLRAKGRARPLEIGQAMKRLGDCTKRRVQIGDNRQLYHPVTRVDFWEAADNDVWATEIQKGKR